MAASTSKAPSAKQWAKASAPQNQPKTAAKQSTKAPFQGQPPPSAKAPFQGQPPAGWQPFQPLKSPPKAPSRDTLTGIAGGGRPMKTTIINSGLVLPFHDITDDPYFIRV